MQQLNHEFAVFGGGCFWCTEAIFRRIAGVLSVQSGYSGGAVTDPNYRQVCSGTTGHAEVIQIAFDPDVIDYATLLLIHLLTHDPTTLNQQGHDRGTQYRSIVLYRDVQQQQTAEDVIGQLKGGQSAFKGFFEDIEFQRIVTEIKAFETFYPAEIEHQDYFERHSNASYCQIIIQPKLDQLLQAMSLNQIAQYLTIDH